MIANYHTHTARCHHASGTEREYIESALQNGLTVLGFSDHAPMPFEGDYRSTFRMDVNQIDDYCQTLSDLKKEYARDITLHIGFECEYYPAVFPRFSELIKDYPIEYLILGQHATDNEYDGVWSGALGHDRSVVHRYVDQLIEAMKTGMFSYIAHPDLPTRDDPSVWQEEMLRLCRAAKEEDIPLEFNLLGYCEKRQYPHPLFWNMVQQVQNRVIIGIDAHAPDHLNRVSVSGEAEKELLDRGLTPLNTLDLRSPIP